MSKNSALRHAKANAVAYLALFVAMGGTATAAGFVVTSPAQIAPDTINAGHIIDGQVTHSELAAGAVDPTNLAAGAVRSPALATNAVGSSAIADGSITRSDLSDGAVTGAKVGQHEITWDKLASNAVGPANVGKMWGVRAVSHLEQYFTTGNPQAIGFAQEEYDDVNAHYASHDSRFNAPVDGRYEFTGSVEWGPHRVGSGRDLAIRKNGTTLLTRVDDTQPNDNPGNDGGMGQQVTATVDLKQGDYLEMVATSYDDTTASLDAFLDVPTATATFQFVGAP